MGQKGITGRNYQFIISSLKRLTAVQEFYQALTQNQVNRQNPDYVSVQPRLVTNKVTSHLVSADPIVFRQLGKAKLNLGSSEVLSSYQEELQALLGQVEHESPKFMCSERLF